MTDNDRFGSFRKIRTAFADGLDDCTAQKAAVRQSQTDRWAALRPLIDAQIEEINTSLRDQTVEIGYENEWWYGANIHFKRGKFEGEANPQLYVTAYEEAPQAQLSGFKVRKRKWAVTHDNLPEIFDAFLAASAQSD